MLKKIRLVLAAIVVVLFAYAFSDFNNSDGVYLAEVAHSQIVPAIISGSIVLMVLFFVLTLLFGRLYCSLLCPLGILQDVIGWIVIKIRKIFKLKRVRSKYHKPYNIVRYGVLTVTAASAAFGSSLLLLLLDPYSNFGRIIISLFKPLVLWVNNIAATIEGHFGSYNLFRVDVSILSWGLFIFSIVVLITLMVMVAQRGRLWCNTLCPVGTLLGLVSRYSFLRFTVDEDRCNHCKKCVSQCKAECISDSEAKIDMSRCVSCFNCIGECKTKAVGYKPFYKIAKKESVKEVSQQVIEGVSSRKEFLTLAATAIVVPIAAKATGFKFDASRYPLPPGAGSLQRFQKRCTACQLCVSACPSHVLKPAMFENGVSGFMQPYLEFGVHKFCEYECMECIKACPNNALEKIDLQQKKQTQIGVVNFNIDKCVVKVKDEYCGACAEHCPTQAVHMVAYGTDGLTIPSLDPDICIGCGACESICPVRPEAIFIVRTDPQKQVDLPTIKKSEEVNVDDFGF